MVSIVFASIFLSLIGFLILFVSFSMLTSMLAGAPLVNTPPAIYSPTLKLAQLKPGQTFVEIGCGAGNLLREAGKTGATVRGIDLSPLAYILARLNLRHTKNVSVVLGNVFDQSIEDADVVYCYLLPQIMKKLEPKFAAELKPGAKVISYAFQLPTKQPTTIIPRNGSLGRIFLYTY